MQCRVLCGRGLFDPRQWSLSGVGFVPCRRRRDAIRAAQGLQANAPEPAGGCCVCGAEGRPRSDGGSGRLNAKAICDPRGPYVAVLTTDEGRPQNSGRQFDVLRIIPRKERKTVPRSMRASARIMSFDLQDYSIVSLAFPEEFTGQAVFRTTFICKARKTALFTAWSGIRRRSKPCCARSCASKTATEFHQ